jgi:ketosteroid isomerase-like protein
MDNLGLANEEWNKAWLTKNVATVERMAAEDYVYIGPLGQMLDRTALLEIIRSPSYRLNSGNWTEVSITRLSADSALVLDRFQGDGEYRGQPFKEDHRHTTVWICRHGGWQVRLEHCSAITAA